MIRMSSIALALVVLLVGIALGAMVPGVSEKALEEPGAMIQGELIVDLSSEAEVMELGEVVQELGGEIVSGTEVSDGWSGVVRFPIGTEADQMEQFRETIRQRVEGVRWIGPNRRGRTIE